MKTPFQAPTLIRPAITGRHSGSDSIERHDIAADTSLMAEMREHLRLARPTSGNEALRVLRAAYPDVPLAERVRVAGEMGVVPGS